MGIKSLLTATLIFSTLNSFNLEAQEKPGFKLTPERFVVPLVKEDFTSKTELFDMRNFGSEVGWSPIRYTIDDYNALGLYATMGVMGYQRKYGILMGIAYFPFLWGNEVYLGVGYFKNFNWQGSGDGDNLAKRAYKKVLRRYNRNEEDLPRTSSVARDRNFPGNKNHGLVIEAGISVKIGK